MLWRAPRKSVVLKGHPPKIFEILEICQVGGGRGGSRAGLWGAVSVFSCEKCLNTIAYHRKHYCLGAMAPVPLDPPLGGGKRTVGSYREPSGHLTITSKSLFRLR